MKLKVLQTTLAALRAVHWSHWASHWQVRGSQFYGDHIMFERLYNAVEEEIDTLAEKIVAEFGPDAVGPFDQAGLMSEMLAHFRNEKDPLKRGVIAEEFILDHLTDTYDTLKRAEQCSLGLDDFIMSTHNAHETATYLLRQRTR